MNIIYKPYFDFDFKKYDLQSKVKIIDNRRISSIWAYKETEKNLELAREHNGILLEIEALNKRLREIVNQMEEKITTQI